MIQQIIILILLVSALSLTLCLYMLEAKKQVEYKEDERWQLIEYKANKYSDIANSILMILVFVVTTIGLFVPFKVTFTLTRVSIYVLIFMGFRNAIKFFALLILDKTY